MKIVKAFIKNFLAIEKAELELSDRGLLLIQGDNKDDTSANSNGAGKSSLADAICWALYGVTARGVTSDRVVNRSAKRNTMVELHLEEGADEYVIVRYRKDDKEKNQTFVYKRPPTPGMAATELHKATERETQEVINKLIGCSLDVFQAAVYMGQEKMPDLPGMTDKQLKLTIEEAAGTEILVAAYEKAREHRAMISAKMTGAQLTLTGAQTNLTAVESYRRRTHESYTEFEAQRKVKAKKELEEIPTTEASLKGVEEKLAECIAKNYEGQLADVRKKMAGLKDEEKKKGDLMLAVNTAQRQLSAAASDLKFNKELYDKAVKNLDSIDTRVGQPCDKCGKPYCEEDMAEVRKLAKAEADTVRESLRASTVKYKAAKEKHEEAEAALKAFTDTATDTTELMELHNSLSEQVTLLNRLKMNRQSYIDHIARVKERAKAKLTEANPFQKDLKNAEDCEASAKKDVEDAEKKLEAIEEELQIAESACKVFGQSGVRAHILDTVTPFLNDRTAHYLSIMADGNIKAVWNTLQTNAKGEVKEKFNIEVTNDKGGDSFDSLSGGEKRKVRLAAAMALQDMVAARATKPINIFIADEVDHALDAAGLERLMTIMNEKAKDRGTVLIISHSDLKDWVDNVITVRKEKGHSEVSGSTKATGAFA